MKRLTLPGAVIRTKEEAKNYIREAAGKMSIQDLIKIECRIVEEGFLDWMDIE